MSGLTVSTSKLIDTLTDALQTADNTVGGIHLATTRGPWREEPGNVDLLAFTSTDRYTVGHTWIPVDGQLWPSVWPCENAVTVLAICKSLLARRGKDHTVDIDLVQAEPGPDANAKDEHPGWVVSLSETPALFASDTEFQFHAHPEDKFPIRSMRRGPGILAPLVAVAKRRKMQLQFFESPWRRIRVVQIGDTWLGAATPGTPLAGEHGEQPSIEPVFAELVGAE